jgi:hypothetical protein
MYFFLYKGTPLSEIAAGRPPEQKQLILASQTEAHKTPPPPESPFSLCNVTDREREGGVGLRMRSKLEYLLFRSMWETYFYVHFQSRYGRLKPLQSFWYTLCSPHSVLHRTLTSANATLQPRKLYLVIGFITHT